MISPNMVLNFCSPSVAISAPRLTTRAFHFSEASSAFAVSFAIFAIAPSSIIAPAAVAFSAMALAPEARAESIGISAVPCLPKSSEATATRRAGSSIFRMAAAESCSTFSVDRSLPALSSILTPSNSKMSIAAFWPLAACPITCDALVNPRVIFSRETVF